VPVALLIVTELLATPLTVLQAIGGVRLGALWSVNPAKEPGHEMVRLPPDFVTVSDGWLPDVTGVVGSSAGAG